MPRFYTLTCCRGTSLPCKLLYLAIGLLLLTQDRCFERGEFSGYSRGLLEEPVTVPDSVGELGASHDPQESLSAGTRLTGEGVAGVVNFPRDIPDHQRREIKASWRFAIDRLDGYYLYAAHNHATRLGDSFDQPLQSANDLIRSCARDNLRLMHSMQYKPPIESFSFQHGVGFGDVLYAQIRPLKLIIKRLSACLILHNQEGTVDTEERLRVTVASLIEGGLFQARDLLKELFLSDANRDILLFYLVSTYKLGSGIDRLLKGGLGNLPNLEYLHEAEKSTIDEGQWVSFMLKLLLQTYREVLEKLEQHGTQDVFSFLRSEKLTSVLGQQQHREKVLNMAAVASQMIKQPQFPNFNGEYHGDKLLKMNYHILRYLLRFSHPSLQTEIKTNFFDADVLLILKAEGKLHEMEVNMKRLAKDFEKGYNQLVCLRERVAQKWIKGPPKVPPTTLPFLDSLAEEMELLGFQEIPSYVEWLGLFTLNHKREDQVPIFQNWIQNSERASSKLESSFDEKGAQDTEIPLLHRWLLATHDQLVQESSGLIDEMKKVEKLKWKGKKLSGTKRAKIWSKYAYYYHIQGRFSDLSEQDIDSFKLKKSSIMSLDVEGYLRWGVNYSPFLEKIHDLFCEQHRKYESWLVKVAKSPHLQSLKERWMERDLNKHLVEKYRDIYYNRATKIELPQ